MDQSIPMLAASAVSHDVILAVLLSLISSLVQALKTILSSSHSYKSCFCLPVSGDASVVGSWSISSTKTMSFARASILMLVLPDKSVGQRVGQAGIKSYFLLLPTSMTKSSYSMRCSRQGVVSNTGGTETGAHIKPKKDIN